LLYKHLFPAYNIIYPIFKKRQDADEITYLKKIIKPGDIILDIGANIGFYSKILSQCTGQNGKVHAFEPDQINFKHLKKNLATASNVILNNKAVSDKSEKIKIYKSKDLNVDHRTYPVGEYESIDVIDAITIDEYVNNAWRVDIIKMDIQGFEVSALRGMEKTIQANPNIQLLLEFWPHGLKAAGSSVSQFYEVITSLGLGIRFLEKDQLIPFDPENIKDYDTWGLDRYNNIVVSR